MSGSVGVADISILYEMGEFAFLSFNMKYEIRNQELLDQRSFSSFVQSDFLPFRKPAAQNCCEQQRVS